MPAREYISKPATVTAYQFQGWSNAEEICQWLSGAFFVPMGYDHSMRTEDEHKNLDYARSFLIVEERDGIGMRDPNEDTRKRVNPTDWIVRDTFDRVVIMSASEFRALYDEKDRVINSLQAVS